MLEKVNITQQLEGMVANYFKNLLCLAFNILYKGNYSETSEQRTLWGRTICPL